MRLVITYSSTVVFTPHVADLSFFSPINQDQSLSDYPSNTFSSYATTDMDQIELVELVGGKHIYRVS